VNAALWVTAVRICTIPVVMALVLVNTDQTRWWAAGLYAFARQQIPSTAGWRARGTGHGRRSVPGSAGRQAPVSAALVCLVQLARSVLGGDDHHHAEFAVTGLRWSPSTSD